MSIEVATYVNDLQPANPPGTDPRGQGDDHLRLIKQVLQNQFPGASRPRPIETILSKAADYSVLKTDDQATIYFTAGLNLTMPSLLSADAGWQITCFNTAASPVFILPPGGGLTVVFSGTLSVPKARRAIPGVYFKIVWTGTNFIVGRCIGLPIGTLLDFNGSGLPTGFEWPNGQTLASASTNYPEYNSLVGSGATPDYRGRVAVTLDNLGGSSAGRLAGGVITGTAIGNTGGVDTVTLNTTQIPSHTHANTVGETAHSHIVGFEKAGIVSSSQFATGSEPQYVHAASTVSTQTATAGVTITNAAAGGSALHSNIQPSIMCSKILIVE